MIGRRLHDPSASAQSAVNLSPSICYAIGMASPNVAYLIFDIETVADGDLVARLRYPGEKLKPAAAVRKYRDELLTKNESDFIPYTFQIPISVAVAKVAADYKLIDLVLL